MSKVRNLLIVASAIMLFAGIEARAQIIDVSANISGSSGSVQGSGMASTGYGHLSYFSMQITGPDGGGQAYTANLSQNQNFLEHSVSSTYRPDTDYDVHAPLTTTVNTVMLNIRTIIRHRQVTEWTREFPAMRLMGAHIPTLPALTR